MFSEVLKLGTIFKNLYFNPIKIDQFTVTSDLIDFAYLAFSFLVFMMILHSIVIFIAANINNTYPYFRMILLANIYSFTVAFLLSKIAQMLILLALYFMPFIGQHLVEFGIYITIGVAFIFEYLLMTNRLGVLYQRGHLESEAINSDILIGVIFANAASFILFSLI